MTRAIDFANFFIDVANNTNDCMTNLKLNKLLYFAQAWSLARRGKPLFSEDIQAWDLGPVTPTVYREFRKYGKERIPAVVGNYDCGMFSAEELDLLVDIAREYGKYSAPTLVDMSHVEGGPWKETRQANKQVIPKEKMRQYFSSLAPLRSVEISETDFIGYRDSDGYLVWPKELDDGE